MLRRELGSEFFAPEPYASKPPFWDGWAGDRQYYVSGRTALDAIIADAQLEREIRTARLPSYCCHTMIEPFIKRGIDVSFYPVTVGDGALNIRADAEGDITLMLDYFGFAGFAPECATAPDSAAGNTLIWDCTQTLLCKDAGAHCCDYMFASFRKWGAVSGAAVAIKRNGAFAQAPAKRHGDYIALRERAYELKRDYICGRTDDKTEYLDLFKRAESLLERDYTGYAADADALECASGLIAARDIRRQNASALMEGIAKSSLVTPIYSEIKDCDAPLFVPIIVKNGLRDRLRQYLTDNGVYCPCHWPLSPLHSVSPDERALYDGELSLICDQRYTQSDMQREAELIMEFNAYEQ